MDGDNVDMIGRLLDILVIVLGGVTTIMVAILTRHSAKLNKHDTEIALNKQAYLNAEKARRDDNDHREQQRNEFHRDNREQHEVITKSLAGLTKKIDSIK